MGPFRQGRSYKRKYPVCLPGMGVRIPLWPCHLADLLVKKSEVQYVKAIRPDAPLAPSPCRGWCRCPPRAPLARLPARRRAQACPAWALGCRWACPAGGGAVPQGAAGPGYGTSSPRWGPASRWSLLGRLLRMAAQRHAIALPACPLGPLGSLRKPASTPGLP